MLLVIFLNDQVQIIQKLECEGIIFRTIIQFIRTKAQIGY